MERNRRFGCALFMCENMRTRNDKQLNEIVQDGNYGLKVAYTDVEQITAENVINVVGNTIGTFYRNRRIAEYLWTYKNGDQPVLYRTNTMRSDINNLVCENHAWEVVRFKNGQTNGEPIYCISLSEDKKINEAVDKFNNYCRAIHKHARDISSGEWTSATGTGFKAVQRTNDEVPFRIVVPTPLNTYIIYQRGTEEPMLAVQMLKDADGNDYKLCYSKTHEYRIQNGSLNVVDRGDGTMVKAKLHAFGGIPIVEYPNNQDRISDIALVWSLLDSINEMQSNRQDAISQFVQSWVKFVNVDIDEETFEKMKMQGALVVKSNNGENKADVDIMAQELNQSQSQVAKEDLWNNVLTILAIPNKEGNTGGDTQGAVALRNGWDFSKQAARLKDPYIIEAETRLDRVILNVIRQAKGAEDCPLGIMDYEPHINHSPQDNMQVKSQVFVMLVQAGIHPLIAMKVCGLWEDAEKTYLISKPYLDVLYKTIDEVEAKEEQEQKANELMAQFMQQQNNQEQDEQDNSKDEVKDNGNSDKQTKQNRSR